MAIFSASTKDNWTVAEVKAAWETTEGQAMLSKIGGDRCPCCAGHVQIYKRHLSKSMAIGLKIFAEYLSEHALTEAHAEKVFEVYTNPSRLRGDFAKLRFWEFIEKVKGERPDGNPDNGFYRMTDYGYEFLSGQTEASKFYVEYRSKVQEWASDYVKWQDVSENFHYDRDVRCVDVALEPKIRRNERKVRRKINNTAARVVKRE